jgi:hypothetical protein
MQKYEFGSSVVFHMLGGDNNEHISSQPSHCYKLVSQYIILLEIMQAEETSSATVQKMCKFWNL